MPPTSNTTSRILSLSPHEFVEEYIQNIECNL